MPGEGDGIPPLADGAAVAAVVLLGNTGGSLWPAFSASGEYSDGQPHPLDRWTRRVVDKLARGFGAQALYPFGGPPHWPFQRWAVRAEAVFPSPLGLLVDPRYGLWHAYRAALLFAEPIELPEPVARKTPCASCARKPCLSACPVDAFSVRGYDVGACARSISSTAGADCMSNGCRARAACPVGVEYAYPAAQQQFHMAAFERARRL